MFNTKEIALLLKKKMEGTLTSEEAGVLDAWVKEDIQREEFLSRISDDEIIQKDVLLWLELQQSDQKDWLHRLEQNTWNKINKPKEKKIRLLYRYLPYAAALLLFGILITTYYNKNQDKDNALQLVKHDLEPGGNKASLIVDGQKVTLKDDKEGIRIGEELLYEDGMPIGFDINDGASSKMAELQVPRGGQYKVTLPDGSRVWLNSASSLRYPIKFSAEKREVELEGEAYFEVAKAYKKTEKGRNEKIPFYVKTPRQTVEVLGTSFNVMAYKDEEVDKTTLVEGGVFVKVANREITLRPGEQSSTDGSDMLKKATVNIDDFIAWKENRFAFDDTELKEAIRQLSRWYDFDVQYAENVPTTHFYGRVSRDKTLSEVLQILKKGGVNFKLDKSGERTVLTVLP